MIIDLLPRLAALRIVLASASPRRLEILRQVGLNPHVQPSTFAEDLDKARYTPEQYVVETARLKAVSVVDALAESAERPDIVISSDSVVVVGSQILEKPKSEDECRGMMRLLSGATHRVLSGVCVVALGRLATDAGLHTGAHAIPTNYFCSFESTEVTFGPLEPAMIDAYVGTRDPYDKAGGYGIQSVAAQFISKINGDYYNVVGLPIHSVCATLRRIIAAAPPPPV